MVRKSDSTLNLIQKLRKNNILEDLTVRLYSDEQTYSFTISDTTKEIPILTNSNINKQLQLIEDNTTKIDSDFNKTYQKQIIANLIKKKYLAENNSPVNISYKDYMDQIDTSDICTITDVDTLSDSLQLYYTQTDFNTISTYDELIKHELIQNILNYLDEQKTENINLTDLETKTYPLRQTIFTDYEAIMSNLNTFNRPINLTVLTLLKSKDQYYILAGKRSNYAYRKNGFNSLIPSGLCRDTIIEAENKLKEKFIYLYAQEIFNIQNPAITMPKVKGIGDILQARNTKFVKTGVSLNLLYMNLEISAICIIENEKYLENLTSLKKTGIKNNKLSIIPVNKIEEQREFIKETFTSSDLYTLNQGLKYLKYETDIDIPFKIDVK